jgi:hypothetical protein
VTTVSGEGDVAEAEDDADLRVARSASDDRETVITFEAWDWIRYDVKIESTLIWLNRMVLRELDLLKTLKTHDQTCIPPSFASLLHIMCISSSVNLMRHFFCNFSMACTIPTGISAWGWMAYIEKLTEKRRDVLNRSTETHYRTALDLSASARDISHFAFSSCSSWPICNL